MFHLFLKYILENAFAVSKKIKKIFYHHLDSVAAWTRIRVFLRFFLVSSNCFGEIARLENSLAFLRCLEGE
jgi:hypothetical protein